MQGSILRGEQAVSTVREGRRVIVQQVLNGFCANGQHEQCLGMSKGSKSDPVTFVCTCECHLGDSK